MRLIALTIAALFTFGASSAFADAAAGEAAYKAHKCNNCHKLTAKKKVGPGLAGVSKRASDEWMKAWFTDAKAVWTANEGYTVELKKMMKKEGKPKPSHKVKKKLSDQEITDLIAYMKTL